MSMCWHCFGILSQSNGLAMSKMLSNLIAFAPPRNITYKISKTSDDSAFRGAVYKKVVFLHSEYKNVTYPYLEVECYQLKKCTNQNRIVLLHIKNNSIKTENKATIILSHGNACDLGIIFPFMMDMSYQTKSDVISYDYSGYGRSEGHHSEEEMYSDIEQVMDFCIIFLNLKLTNVILLGISLGSVPTVHIAVHHLYCAVKGVVLLSPISSGIKLIDPTMSACSEDLEKVDVFCNLAKASDISCQVLLIHGKLDEVIPISQSRDLMKRIKYAYEWFPTRGTHSNIITKYRSKFYTKLKLFIEQLKYNIGSRHNKQDLDISDQSNLDITRISLKCFHRKLKDVKCEDNYISISRDNKYPVGVEDNTSNSNKHSEKSPVVNCLSIQRKTYINTSSESHSPQSIDKTNDREGLRTSEDQYNEIELEYEYNQIEKKVQI